MQEEEDPPDAEDKPVDRSLGKDALEGRFVPAGQAIIGSNESASAMYDFVPTMKLKGLEEFIDESEYYERYERVGEDAVPVHVVPASGLSVPEHLHAYG